MSEQESIDQAYSDTVETLFRVFFEAFTAAQGNDNAEQAAKTRFQKGIIHARYVREVALSLLPK